MNTGQANGIVVTSLFVTGTLVVVKGSVTGQPPPLRFVFGLTITGVGLAALSQLGAPELAASLALLVVATSAVVYGGPAWDALSRATNASPSSTTRNPVTVQPPRLTV